ncbi:MAG: YdcF family protein [Polyangiaceae bacterium]
MFSGLGGLVILGCRSGRGRTELGAKTFHARRSEFSCVIASGGRAWPARDDRSVEVEADVIASDLIARGVPAQIVVRERCSHSTRENARYCAMLLARRGIDRATLVTADWHVPRALLNFRREGLVVDAVGVPSSRSDFAFRLHVLGHELGARIFDRVVR